MWSQGVCFFCVWTIACIWNDEVQENWELCVLLWKNLQFYLNCACNTNRLLKEKLKFMCYIFKTFFPYGWKKKIDVQHCLSPSLKLFVFLFCAKCGKSGTKVAGTKHVKLPWNWHFWFLVVESYSLIAMLLQRPNLQKWKHLKIRWSILYNLFSYFRQ